MSEYAPYKVHNRIKMLRKNRGLTLKELGSAIGIRDNTLSQYENEKRNPSDEIWLKMARYFQVSTEYLRGFTNDDSETPDLIFDYLKETSFSENPKRDFEIRNALEDSFSLLLQEISGLKEKIKELNDPDYYDPN